MPRKSKKLRQKKGTCRYRKRSLRNKRAKKFSKRLGKGRIKGGLGKILEEKKEVLSPLLENVDERTKNLLQVACGKQSAGNCLDLGSYKTAVTRFFENFQNFQLIDFNEVRRIGESSTNGFVLELPFKKLEYTAYAVLKCSNNNESDNLLYEYYAGKNFINKYTEIFPCFVETYGAYFFQNERDWEEASRGTNYKIIETLESITPFVLKTPDVLWDFACENASYLSIMIQHFSKAISLSKMKDTKDIYNLLYQIYFPLALLQDSYTHYDLHAGNVLLYKPFDGEKYIQMHYHDEDGNIITFPTEYIAKIIDYGRNFFIDEKNEDVSSKKIIEEYVCKAENCNIETYFEPYEKCGDENGFKVIHGTELGNRPGTYALGDASNKYLNPSTRNHSADLRVVFELLSKTEKNGLFDGLEYDKNFIATPEASNTFSVENKIVSTVQDMRDSLKLFLPEWNRSNSEKYDTWLKVGDLHIYSDLRPSAFSFV